MRSLPSGEMVCNLRLATSERWKDRESGEQREKTEWHSISVFGKPAEVIGEYARKGSELGFSNLRLGSRKWQDQSGNDRYSTVLVFHMKSSFYFLRRAVGQDNEGDNGQQEMYGRANNQQQGGRPNLPNQGRDPHRPQAPA